MQTMTPKQRSGSDVAITVQGLDPREIKTESFRTMIE